MTKADIVNKIAKNTGLEKTEVQTVIEGFMESVTAASAASLSNTAQRRPLVTSRRRPLS